MGGGLTVTAPPGATLRWTEEGAESHCASRTGPAPPPAAWTLQGPGPRPLSDPREMVAKKTTGPDSDGCEGAGAAPSPPRPR